MMFRMSSMVGYHIRFVSAVGYPTDCKYAVVSSRHTLLNIARLAHLSAFPFRNSTWPSYAAFVDVHRLYILYVYGWRRSRASIQPPYLGYNYPFLLLNLRHTGWEVLRTGINEYIMPYSLSSQIYFLSFRQESLIRFFILHRRPLQLQGTMSDLFVLLVHVVGVLLRHPLPTL